MLKNWKTNGCGSMAVVIPTVVLVVAAWLATPAWAQKGKPGGGGGGSTPTFQVVRLADQSGVVDDLNDTRNGVVELVGRAGGQGLYWTATENSGQVTTTFRTLPPLDEGFQVYPRAINNTGIIVGHQTDINQETATPLVWLSGLADLPVALPVPDLYVTEPVQDEEGADDQIETYWQDEDAYARGISDDGLIVGLIHQRQIPGVNQVPDYRYYVIVWKWEIVDGQFQVQDHLLFEIDDYTNASISANAGYLTFYEWQDWTSPAGPFHPRAIRVQIGWDDELEFLYEIPGTWQQLVDGDAYVNDVNSSGIVVGRQSNPDSNWNYGFAIDLDGIRRKIPTLPSFRKSGTLYHYAVFYARAISDRNEVLSDQWSRSDNGTLYSRRDVVGFLDGSTAIDLSTYDSN